MNRSCPASHHSLARPAPKHKTPYQRVKERLCHISWHSISDQCDQLQTQPSGRHDQHLWKHLLMPSVQRKSSKRAEHTLNPMTNKLGLTDDTTDRSHTPQKVYHDYWYEMRHTPSNLSLSVVIYHTMDYID